MIQKKTRPNPIQYHSRIIHQNLGSQSNSKKKTLSIETCRSQKGLGFPTMTTRLTWLNPVSPIASSEFESSTGSQSFGLMKREKKQQPFMDNILHHCGTLWIVFSNGFSHDSKGFDTFQVLQDFFMDQE